jgi:site-specific recombinase XerD
MLESYFSHPGVLRRMRRGPLTEEIDGLATDLERIGYSGASARRYLSLGATFSRYAAQNGCEKEGINAAFVERFLEEVPSSPGMRSQAKTAVGHLVRRLGLRYPQVEGEQVVEGPIAALLAGFDTHMKDVRGLQPRSREGVLRVARRMIEWYQHTYTLRPLSELDGKVVLAFVSHVASSCPNSSSRSEALSCVRGFLRWLRWDGVTQDDLARLVPRVPFWRLAGIPSHLEWSTVRAVIDSIDASTPVGKRDRALLLVLATTGLRSQEVRRLELQDIRWRSGELRVGRTKGGRERVVPLLDEAGRALADYVLHGRPRITEPTVFLRHVPPAGPIAHSSTLASIVRRSLARCGINLPRAGAHLIRHSLATRMVQRMRPIKEVADLLGHRSIDTTAIYVKVALPQLESVALPFPGGEA